MTIPPTGTRRLTLALHGVFSARGPSGRELSGLSRRGQALLAFLSQQPGMRAERARIADLLWSDRSEVQARASLRQELSVLRRALPDGVLEANRQHVWLDPARVLAVASGSGAFLDGFDLASEGFEDWLRDMRQGDHPVLPAPGSPVPVIAQRNRPSLAVQPFEEIGAGVDDMFAVGIVEEITGALSRVHDFHVIARQSAFALRGDDLAAPEMAERLGAQYVVQGSVRRAGDRVRIAVQLVDGRDGRTLWSDRFDDQLDDLFALQDRIAVKVAGQLSPSLRTAEILRARTRPPNDRTAYETVLSAMPYFWAHNRADNARAVDLFDEALARDPDYPLALAMKAWALAHQTAYLWTDDPAQVRHDSIALANQAAVNAGDHVLTLIGVGAAISNASTEVGRARSFLEHALAIDPNSAWGWMRMGYLEYYTDRPRRAREAFDRAISLSPLDPYLHNMVIGQGIAEFRAGNYDEARRLVERGMQIGPGVRWALRHLVTIYQKLGRDEDAFRAATEFKNAHPGITLRLIKDSIPPSLSTNFSTHFDGLRKAGVPEH